MVIERFIIFTAVITAIISARKTLRILIKPSFGYYTSKNNLLRYLFRFRGIKSIINIFNSKNEYYNEKL